MNELSITCFLSLVRTKSYIKTARDLSITQQVLSRKIARMEEEIGFPLFNKNYNTVELTVAGERFYETFSSFERDLSAASSLSDDEAATLRVGCCQWAAGDGTVIESLKLFTQENPDMPLRLTGGTGAGLRAMIESGEIDLAVTTKYFARHIETPYLSDDLYEMPLFLAMSENHPIHDQVILPEVLRGFPYLVNPACNEPENDLLANVRLECAKMDFMPRTISVYPNLDSVYFELHLGNGISFLPRSKKNVGARISYIPTPRTVTIVTILPQLGQNRRAKQLADFLTGNIGKITGEGAGA